MSLRRRFGASVLLASLTFALGSFALVAGCSSSSDSSGGGPSGDSGLHPVDAHDTGATVDTGLPSLDDSAVIDGSGNDAGGGTCDQHAGDECNMVAQDCADPTATCLYDSTAKHNTCQKLPQGPAAKGEACDDKTPCARGLFCDYGNKCAPACCPGDDSVCGPGGTCSLDITDGSGPTADVIYHECIYAVPCHPFQYDCPATDVCVFESDPSTFNCATPTSNDVSTAPGGACSYQNDCGESQICTELTVPGQDAGSGARCYLFCDLNGPDAGSVGADPGKRFAANGTCNVGGKSYGNCVSVQGIGGGLGLCVP